MGDLGNKTDGKIYNYDSSMDHIKEILHFKKKKKKKPANKYKNIFCLGPPTQKERIKNKTKEEVKTLKT